MTWEELAALVASTPEETASLEFKQGVGDENDVVATLVAFSNDLARVGGGRVICGVREEKDAAQRFTLVGMERSRADALKKTILGRCMGSVQPGLLPPVQASEPIPDPTGKLVALIFEARSSDQVHGFAPEKGAPLTFVRLASETRAARHNEILELMRRRGQRPPFLDEPCERGSVEDLDLLAVRDLLGGLGLPDPVESYLQPGLSLLPQMAPLVQTRWAGPDAPLSPTRLAVLLFGRDPRTCLPGAQVLLSVFPGRSMDSDQIQQFRLPADGGAGLSLLRLIDGVMERIDAHLGVEVHKGEPIESNRQNRPRYDRQAIAEAVVNAFAHRDWSSADPVRIHIFSDRIEIESPGEPVGGWDEEAFNLRSSRPQSRWRNPSLRPLLYRWGRVQETGSGIPRIFASERITGRRPRIERSGDGLRVTFPALSEPIGAGRAVDELATLRADTAGLLLVSIGGEALRPYVIAALPELGLQGATVAVELTVDDYLQDGQWEPVATELRNQLRVAVEDRRFTTLHLFYRGPAALASLVGAIIPEFKPLVLYHYEEGRYRRVAVFDRRFLKSRV